MDEVNPTTRAPQVGRALHEKSFLIGQYLLFDVDEKLFGIAHPTGECGVFNKDDFEAYVSAFFGLNF